MFDCFVGLSLKGLIYMYMHVYVSMYVLFCHVLYGCFVCILYAYICMYLCICIFACLYICMFYVYVYLYVCISGIYPSNFDVRLKAQKSQSSN